MTDLTDSQQNTYGANLIVGLRDGDQTVAPSVRCLHLPNFEVTNV